MIKTANLRERTRAHRATARLRRNGGLGSLTTHCMAQGLRKKQAESVAGSLRDKTEKLGITGVDHLFYVGGTTREGKRYSHGEVAAMALVYRPRLALYRLAATELRRFAD